MKHGLPTVAVVGRPNVGKSTLFNRILGKNIAIVEDQPGVTRDRNFARAEWAARHFYLIDTGGIEVDKTTAELPVAVRRQVSAAIAESDLIVFVVDGKIGPHPIDYRVAEMLRESSRPVLLVVNKMDRWPEDMSHLDFWELGVGEPVPVSAHNGKGSGDLLDKVVEAMPPNPHGELDIDALSVAVIGKPNVGKSSFINRLLGEERLVVSETAGTTRDSIDTPLRYKEQTLVFVDTAGLRRQSKVDESVEYFSGLRTERAIDRADVCVLLLDATEEVHIQDLRISEKAWSRGTSLIIVANKWDLVEKETGTAEKYELQLKERAPQLRWVPMLFTSALTGQRVQRVLDLVLQVAEQRNKRIATREVNEVVKELAIRQPPPHHRGMPVKLMYSTQADSAPPTFVIFVNHPKAVPESYIRYLQNGFREAWGFMGSPIRIRLKARREKKE